jgi:uncharacterized protein YjaG (DUF416 family)
MTEESNMIVQLQSLPLKSRVAFAASCCERLVPNYLAFSRMESWGDYEFLRKSLDEVWAWLDGVSFTEQHFRELAETCTNLAPDTEEFSTLFVSAAGDAVAAVVYTLECCLDGDEKKAAIVRGLTTETIYMYLVRVNDPNVEAHLSDPAFDEQMLHAPLMEAEKRKLQQDIDLLERNPTLNSTVLADLRNSSAKAGIQPLERGLVK